MYPKLKRARRKVGKRHAISVVPTIASNVGVSGTSASSSTVVRETTMEARNSPSKAREIRLAVRHKLGRAYEAVFPPINVSGVEDLEGMTSGIRRMSCFF